LIRKRRLRAPFVFSDGDERHQLFGLAYA